jgi:hypothetical protein
VPRFLDECFISSIRIFDPTQDLVQMGILSTLSNRLANLPNFNTLTFAQKCGDIFAVRSRVRYLGFIRGSNIVLD